MGHLSGPGADWNDAGILYYIPIVVIRDLIKSWLIQPDRVSGHPRNKIFLVHDWEQTKIGSQFAFSCSIPYVSSMIRTSVRCRLFRFCMSVLHLLLLLRLLSTPRVLAFFLRRFLCSLSNR